MRRVGMRNIMEAQARVPAKSDLLFHRAAGFLPGVNPTLDVDGGL
jgi:hypothetical protein